MSPYQRHPTGGPDRTDIFAVPGDGREPRPDVELRPEVEPAGDAPSPARGVVTADGRVEPNPPRWRRDFPVDLPEDHYVARRDFTKFLGLTSFAFVVGQVWIGVQNMRRRRTGQPPIVKIAAHDSLPVGGALAFHYPGENDHCLLVRTGEENFAAYNQMCTHLSCAVQPQVEQGRLHCPCHQGFFELATGRPIAGPPRRPLHRVLLEVRRDGVYATGMEVSTV